MEFNPENQRFERNDVKQNISAIERSSIRDISKLEQKRPWILIPEEFYNATVQMCNTERETRGVLLGTKELNAPNERYGISGMISIGYGTAGGVYVDPDKLEAINKFLARNPGIRAIDFHTHTTGTGTQYGTSYYDNFSDMQGGDDIESLKNNVNKNSNYKHILFTPTKVISFGLNLPQVAVIDFYDRDLLKNKIKTDLLVDAPQSQKSFQEQFDLILKEVRQG